MEPIRFATLRVSAVSPDKSLRVRLTADGFTVDFGPDGVGGHSADSLARQLSAAVHAVVQGRLRAVQPIVERSTENIPLLAGRDQADLGEERTRLWRESEKVEVEAVSPRGGVTAWRGGERDCGVRVEAGAIRRFGDEQLAAEIAGALNAADEKYLRGLRAAHRATRRPVDFRALLRGWEDRRIR